MQYAETGKHQESMSVRFQYQPSLIGIGGADDVHSIVRYNHDTLPLVRASLHIPQRLLRLLQALIPMLNISNTGPSAPPPNSVRAKKRDPLNLAARDLRRHSRVKIFFVFRREPASEEAGHFYRLGEYLRDVL